MSLLLLTARPFFAASVIPESLEMLGSVPGVIAAVPATYTMKEVRNGHVRRTIPRETLYRVNTPQIFRKNELAAAFIKADADKITVTDDAMLLEHAGYDVAVCSDTPDNLKITTASDLATAAEIYRKNKNLFRGNHD